MTQHRTIQISFREIAWLAACAALIAGAFLYGNADIRKPLSSAETRFVETSPSGLQIVPASCPSNPHDGGSCSGNGACNINFVPSPVAQGQHSTLFWSADAEGDGGIGQNFTLSYPGGSDSVSSSGSRTVNGDTTKTYTFSYQRCTAGGCGGTVSCSAILTVCPAGQTVHNGQCVGSAGSCTATFNPKVVAVGDTSIFSWSAAHAGTVFYPGGSFPAPASGQGGVGGNPGETSKTYRFVDGTNGAQCQDTLTVCPAGQTVQNGVCTPGNQCTPQYFCQGSDLYRRTAQCTNQFVQACTYGCSGGGCLPPPVPSGNITASPVLVHRGDTSQISWTAHNVTSCTVTENNADINDSWTGASGTRTSSPLHQQTIYTLSCTGIDGSHFTDSVTVNVIPIENEE